MKYQIYCLLQSLRLIKTQLVQDQQNYVEKYKFLKKKIIKIYVCNLINHLMCNHDNFRDFSFIN